ncbi:MAG: exopolysaccharide biosynthesis polyprenyl glycosylphosphotransferase [Oscillospiraceae bacterium]|nr:exopolysaccharide biosynthesis polyprenyl glycosylphosphotransferase [Oscillospiraceae bacterium]
MKQNTKKKISKSKSLLHTLECAIEVIGLTLLYHAIWRSGYPDGLFPAFYFRGRYVLMGVYAMLLMFFVMNADGFSFGQRKRTDLALGQVTSLFLVNFITYFQLCLIANQMISPWPIITLFVIDSVIALILVFLYAGLHHVLYAPHKMVMIYGSENAVSLKLKMDARRDKYRIEKLLSTELGYEALCQQIVDYDAVVINDIPPKLRNDLLKFCYEQQLRVYLVPKITDVIIRGARDVTLFDTPLVRILSCGPTLMQRIIKRAMDLALSALALVLTSPVLLGVAIAIKLEDGGPVFYKQKRLTLNDKEFNILKFRSMIVDAEKLTGEVLANENDPRITKVGKFIRATRLDELPQIINIFLGDMSIVGPRPERKSFIDEFCKEMPEFSYRTRVKGGLTGYAQVYGKYNTTPYDKLRFDLMYIENYSILLDLKLMILTLRIIFSKESTEGIDIAERNERRKEALLKQLQQDSSEESPFVEMK